MAFTYSICPSCRQLNRVPTGETNSKEPICGKCKASLPLQGAVNILNGSGLLAMVEKSPNPVVADFWAPWCVPCKAFEPILKEAAQQLSGEVTFAKINIQEHPLAGDTYKVKGVPAILLFKGGIEIKRQNGALPLPNFLNWIKNISGRQVA